MATTTPNFGWPVPTSSDLVKNGAVDIEALGDGIDASLLDLKGGTTNQVLAKNSNTDMDFKWVTSASASGLTLVSSTTFSAVNSYAIDSVFTSTYANYRVIFEITDTTSTDASMVFRASAADNTTANYSNNSQYALFGANALTAQGATSASAFNNGFGLNSSAPKGGIFVMDILNPQAAKVTNLTVQTLHQGGYLMFGQNRFNATTQFDGFKFSANAMTGTCRIYGYQNS